MVGYGPRFPQCIHHRGASLDSITKFPSHIACHGGSKLFAENKPNPNLLVGAIVGGPDENDQYKDDRADSNQSEPCTYYNAPLHPTGPQLFTEEIDGRWLWSWSYTGGL